MATVFVSVGRIEAPVETRSDIGPKKLSVTSFRLNDGAGVHPVEAWGDLAAKVQVGVFVTIAGKVRSREVESKDKTRTFTVTTLTASSIDPITAPPAAASAPDMFGD